MGSEIEFTEQQIAEVEAVEKIFGSFGKVIFGHNDPALTTFQRDYCQRVLEIHRESFRVELAEQYGAHYPLAVLAKWIDRAVAKHTPSRQAQ